MTEKTITDVVRERYGNAAKHVLSGKAASCCGSAPSASSLKCDPITTDLYGLSEKASIPEQAVLACLGCG
ncbi:MAG TPA: arsenite S-adenosylmethyltransferase, partial [Thermoanaerobaculia bacterium]